MLPLLLAVGVAGVTEEAHAEATIAIIGPWSANLSYAAIGTLRGSELIIEGINSAGGLLGQKLRSVQIDDGCNPAQSEVAAKIAIASHPVVVIGGACAPGATRISRMLADAGILQLVPNVPQEELGDAGLATMFRFSGRSDREGAFTGAIIARRWADRRIAVVDDGQPHWHEGADSVATTLSGRGVGVALRLRFMPNRPSYADFVQELKDKRVELLYLNGLPPDMGLIVRESAALGLGATILVSRNGSTDVFRQTAGPAVEGVYFVDRRAWIDDALAEPALAAEKARGGDLNVFLASAYSAIKIWAAGVTAADTFAAPAVAASIKARSFATPLGRLGFTATGDLAADSEEWTFYRWHEGSPERAD